MDPSPGNLTETPDPGIVVPVTSKFDHLDRPNGTSTAIPVNDKGPTLTEDETLLNGNTPQLSLPDRTPQQGPIPPGPSDGGDAIPHVGQPQGDFAPSEECKNNQSGPLESTPQVGRYLTDGATVNSSSVPFPLSASHSHSAVDILQHSIAPATPSPTSMVDPVKPPRLIPNFERRLQGYSAGSAPPDGQDFDVSSVADGRWRSALDSGPPTPMHPHRGGIRSRHSSYDRAASDAESAPSVRPVAGPSKPATSRPERSGGSLKQLVIAPPVPSPRQRTTRKEPSSDESPQPARRGIRFSRMLSSSTRPTQTLLPPVPPEPVTTTVTNEMMAGTLPVMILKTWLDRDEDGHRAVPVLLGNLRFRIGDSVGFAPPIASGSSQVGSQHANRHIGREMFKIECDYGDGAVRWVVYRELRDFLSLHAHYKAANFGTRVTGLRTSRHVDIPEFPRIAIPYWAWDKAVIAGLPEVGKSQEKGKESSEVARRQEFTPASRDALQQYLLELIRAVMFRPESNRVCIFFELSALTVALAPGGGFQGKAGFIKIPTSKASRRSNQPGLAPSKWRQHRKPKWFIVRESYFVVTDSPSETEIYDVFLIDPQFLIERPKRAYRKGLKMLSGSSTKDRSVKDEKPGEEDAWVPHDEDSKNVSQHTFYIANAQTKLKLIAKSARQMHQFIVSMERVAMQSIWAGKNRFDSFAPIRANVAAQWLVDGRDYFWNLSRAINMAKQRVYIHDWWISPEIYLRRPGDERFRLDNLLKRKAEEGVHIFIIIYNEVSAKTTPVESLYVKKTLMGLHPNIMVQRSPSHLPSGALYWSHHEKLCVIDETIAFMGGLDLCYGRWDTSQHIMTDEDYTSVDGPDGPVWRGKDYFNEREKEYYDLDKPFEDAFDRTRTPRMGWHDVGLQIVGQPARDLCRHFLQRWNYLLRVKNHRRKMPFLLPPADFTEQELVGLRLQGTCEVQICRSVGPWSMGTTNIIEHSIQNAYITSIQLSEHFVYIENQFFITSTVVNGIQIENGIGNALVQRIIHAHRNGQKWRACCVIPSLPGYSYALGDKEASSVRLILECQNRTICRGPHSIFARLRKEGINPEDYICFFSLRGWTKFNSGALATEMVYIHGKTMIVDDRLVLCGSANINERSQRGDRDSEIVAVIRDTDMIDGTMGGKPFKVGRFAHTLRVRLMREHLGVDTDAIDDALLNHGKSSVSPSDSPKAATENAGTQGRGQEQYDPHSGHRGTTKAGGDRVKESFGTASGTRSRANTNTARPNALHPETGVSGRTLASSHDPVEDLSNSPVSSTMEERFIFGRLKGDRASDGVTSRSGTFPEVRQTVAPDSMSGDARRNTAGKGAATPNARHDAEENVEPTSYPRGDLEASDMAYEGGAELTEISTQDTHESSIARKYIRKDLAASSSNRWTVPFPPPAIDPNGFSDPLDDYFWNEIWVGSAIFNTEVFRKVFRAMPDDVVTTWEKYKEFATYIEKFRRTEPVPATPSPQPSDVPALSRAMSGASQESMARSENKNDAEGENVTGSSVNNAGSPTLTHESSLSPTVSKASHHTLSKTTSHHCASKHAGHQREASAASTLQPGSAFGPGASSQPIPEIRQPSGPNDPWADWELREMEELLNKVNGQLVVYPTRFLETEDRLQNFIFTQDRILPLLIYD